MRLWRGSTGCYLRSILDLPIIRSLRRPRSLFLPGVILAVVVVLVHGALTATPPNRPPPSEPSVPRVLASYRPELEKAPLSYQSDYWLQLAERVKSRLFLVGPRRTTAVIVRPQLALTSARMAHGVYSNPGPAPPSAAPSPDASVPATQPPRERLVAEEARLGLALFAFDPQPVRDSRVPADPAALRPGSLVAAVSLAPDGRVRIAPGHVVSVPSASDPTRLDLALARPLSLDMAAVVDLDGRLVGVLFDSGEGLRALSMAGVREAVDRLQAGSKCRPLDVAPVDEGVRAELGVQGGAVVEGVAARAFSGPPPIRPGDIVLEWGGKEVEGDEQFLKLYDAGPSGRPVSYVVMRGRRRLRGNLVLPGDDCRSGNESALPFPDMGIVAQWTGPEGPEEGAGAWTVLSVTPGTPAARAGLEPGARIESIEGRALGRQETRRALEAFGRRPLLLTARHDGRVRLMALSPARK